MVFQLTRYLYIKDEVKLSLIYSLLNKTSYQECLFWISEYYYSGYYTEIWTLIWKIYYDFYAIKNPKLRFLITRMKKKWDNKQEIIYLLHIIKNMYYNGDVDSKVFVIRMAIQTAIFLKSYKGRTPKWLKELNIDRKYKNLLLSIHKEDYANTAYYLKRLQSSEMEHVLIKYFHGIELPNYNNITHILIDRMFHLSLDDKEEVFILSTIKELEYVVETNKVCKKLYKTLQEKRLFNIRPEIGCFHLERDNIPCVKDVERHHWEYYCYLTPLWKERFDKYKIRIDHEKQEIEFADEATTCEEYEDFYERFHYEPDEQNLEVQEKSTKSIPFHTINNFSGDKYLFDLKETKYTY